MVSFKVDRFLQFTASSGNELKSLIMVARERNALILKKKSTEDLCGTNW